jgi:hypothetical protein
MGALEIHMRAIAISRPVPTFMHMTALAALIFAALTASATLSHAQAAPGPQDQADKPNSIPDQNATQEPSAKGAPPSQPARAPAAGAAQGAFVNGSLNVPGADTNSQTSPAKFSQQNDALDKIPVMGRGPMIDGQAKALIWFNVKPGTTAQPGIGGPATELPAGIAASDWPPAVIAKVPGLTGTKYVGLSDRLLVVWPANGVVVEEITK